jgi:hypothetical protein
MLTNPRRLADTINAQTTIRRRRLMGCADEAVA